ncbi:MAG: aspartate/glutamate racemase family protein [Candidatus Caldarchaeum sp.]|nr:aspartate/glutamate racemase family protein [Candidatus Caldarchaeum sp.]MDW8359208.1 aspartate/glutamate racemase family protein [Candidatus Caldarchaeum sp.]
MYRVGLILPSSNTTMEREFNQALSGAATVHGARIKLERAVYSELAALEDEAQREAEKLATAGVDVIVYGCTSGSFIRDSRQYLGIEQRVEKSFGVPCVATSGAVVRALDRLGAKNISMITPYTHDITEIEKRYLEAHDFKVLNYFHTSLTENLKIGKVPDDEVARWAIENTSPEADAVFISCTNLSTFKAIKKVEDHTKKPTISSNSSTLWNVVQILRLKTDLSHLGKLFTLA